MIIIEVLRFLCSTGVQRRDSLAAVHTQETVNLAESREESVSPSLMKGEAA